MKPIITLILMGFFLQACQLFAPTPIESLSISFSPSVIPSDLEAQFPYFEADLKEALLKEGYDLQNLQLSVEATNKDVETRVAAGLVDMAFLRINNYLSISDQVETFLTLTQKGYVFDELQAYQDLIETPELELTTHQRSLIMTTPSPYGLTLKETYENVGSLSWIDLNQAKWCHIIVTSYEGYIYPNLWLIDQYQRRIGELVSKELVVRGYRELIERSAAESCDVIVGPQSLREDYASLWITLRQALDVSVTPNIYRDLFPIGMSPAYYNDVFVISKQSTKFDEKFLNTLRDVMIELQMNQQALFKTLKIEGLTYVDDAQYQAMMPAYQLLNELTR